MSRSILIAFALVMAASSQVASSANRSSASRPAFVDEVTVVVAHAPSLRHVTQVTRAPATARPDHRYAEPTRSSNP